MAVPMCLLCAALVLNLWQGHRHRDGRETDPPTARQPYMVSAFGVSPDRANWGIAGWSMGGTCAVDLTVMHP